MHSADERTELKIPPLVDGDLLSRREFERRFDAMPNLKRAELLEGRVYLPKGVPFTTHGEPHAHLIAWLGTYRIHTAGVDAGGSCSIRFDEENEPQPDAVMLVDRDCGGKAVIDPEGYLASAPDLIGEVTATSDSIDLTIKLPIYLQNGVQEYIVWRVLDRELDWFVLRGNRYERLPPTRKGIFASEVFPGLWLDSNALVRRKLMKVHQVLELGLASPEHKAFVAHLQQAGGEQPK